MSFSSWHSAFRTSARAHSGRTLGPTPAVGLRLVIKAQAQANPLAFDVDIDDLHPHDLSGSYDFVRVRNKAVGHRGDMHEAVLMHADINESAEGSHVGYHTFENHPYPQVGYLLHAGGEGGRGEDRSRVTSGFFKFGEDVSYGWYTEAVVGEIGGPQ